MKIKNFAIGALAAAMLFTGTSVMEAAVYNTSRKFDSCKSKKTLKAA